MSFSAFSSSIKVLFWFSNTATRFSRHLTYSFFFLRHSRAASLERKERENVFESPDERPDKMQAMHNPREQMFLRLSSSGFISKLLPHLCTYFPRQPVICLLRNSPISHEQSQHRNICTSIKAVCRRFDLCTCFDNRKSSPSTLSKFPIDC